MSQLKKGFNVFLVFLLTLSLLTPVTVKANIENSDFEKESCIPVEVRVESWLETLIPLQTICAETFDSEEYGISSENPVVGHAFFQAIEKAVNSKVTIGDIKNGSNGSIYISHIGEYGEFTMGSSMDGWMYKKNFNWANGMSSESLEAGDRLDFYYVGNYFSVVFTEITADKQKAAINENVTLTLTDVDNNSGVQDATIYINGEASEYTTDENGKVDIVFGEEGSYEVTANRYEADPSDMADNNNIIRPVPVVIEVEKAEEDNKNILIELTPDVSTALNTASSYMVSKNLNAKFGAEWDILALSRSGYTVPEDYYENYYNNIVAHLQEKNGILAGNYTEYSRLIIALTAIGKDARNVSGYNLTEKLSDFNKVVKQGINGAIFGLIALDTHEYEIPEVEVEKLTTREELIDYILSKEIEGGGFSLSGRSPADPDITSMAIQGLAPYQNKENVEAVIDRAVEKLVTLQLENGGYSSWGENVQSADQVLVALSTLGIDIATDKRFHKEAGSWILSNIMTYYTADGGFAHPKGGKTNGMATQQTAYALAAYERLLNNQPSLYDMSDVKLTSPENDDEGSTNPGGEGDTGNPTNPTYPGNPGGNPGNPDNPETIEKASISIVISSSEKPLPLTQVDIMDGDSVIDVLTRVTSKNNIALSTRNTEYGVYVEGINGVFEFDRGPLSGWMYRVNGVFPSFSAAYYTVKPGDRIEWLYTTDLGKDIGGNFEDDDAPPTGTKPEEEKPDSPESTISIDNKDGEMRAEISANLLKDLLKDKKSNNIVIMDNQGTKVEIPKSIVNSISLLSGEKLILETNEKTSAGKLDLLVKFEIEKADGTKNAIKTGKEYLKINTSVKDIPKDAVILQLVDGKYKAIPHTVKDGQVTIRTKTSGLFTISTRNVSFKDISSINNKEEIEFLANRGVVTGYENATFEPNKAITRAHFAALIANALGLQAEEDGQFMDTTGQWYENHIQALYEAGITSGTTVSTFNPNANITRQQAAAMMARVLEYVSKKADSSSKLSFKDSQQIDEQFLKSIEIVNSLGIMNGKEDGSFDPRGNLTRGQMAIILTRTLNITDMM